MSSKKSELYKSLRIALPIYVILVAMLTLYITDISDRRAKNYIIEHADEIRMKDIGDIGCEEIIFKIDSCDYSYYTDITVRLDSDSSYNFIFWGDRDNTRWKFRLDKYETFDIPYRKYKGRNVEKDNIIMNLLNKKLCEK